MALYTDVYDLNVYFVCDTCEVDNEVTVEVAYADDTVSLKCENCKADYSHEIGEPDDYDTSCHCHDICRC